jgi:hypothetical protein
LICFFRTNILITRQGSIAATTARRNERMAGEESKQIHLQHVLCSSVTHVNQTRVMECAIFRQNGVRKIVAADMCFVHQYIGPVLSCGGVRIFGEIGHLFSIL